MHNDRIPEPNVLTRRPAARSTGVVIRYRRVRLNKSNNNNNHAALAELFQSSTLHELRQLGPYSNTDTPDTANQLDAEEGAAKVAYTMTNTQPSCSGGRESDRIPNTFNETMDIPQVAGCKEASDKEIESLETHGIFELGSIN